MEEEEYISGEEDINIEERLKTKYNNFFLKWFIFVQWKMENGGFDEKQVEENDKEFEIWSQKLIEKDLEYFKLDK